MCILPSGYNLGGQKALLVNRDILTMRAVQFNITIPRYLTGIALRKLFPSILWSGLSCTREVDNEEPSLPDQEWVKIKTRYGGICGTDMKSIHLDTSTYYSPLVSTSFVLGHEVTGTIVEIGTEAAEWNLGDRVIVEPTLWCKPRGIQPLCVFCAKGETNRCLNVTEGIISPGLHIGGCAETGGGWSPYLVAHRSQLYKVPESVSDENAVLVEPFACAVHSALQNFPSDDQSVLIVGAGTIGLCVVAALRGLGSKARIIVSAKYPFQGESAFRLGADQVIVPEGQGDLFKQVAELTGAEIKKPIIGTEIVVGGADVTFECVGTQSAVDAALRLTRSGGKVSIAGAPGEIKKLDWTALFYQELQVSGAYIFNHSETFNGETRRTFDIAIDLMENMGVDLGWMVTHRFSLDDFKQAMETIHKRSQTHAIKTVFEFD